MKTVRIVVVHFILLNFIVYIVALDKIESIERNRIKITDQLLPIGNNYKDHFNDTLKKPGI